MCDTDVILQERTVALVDVENYIFTYSVGIRTGHAFTGLCMFRGLVFTDV